VDEFGGDCHPLMNVDLPAQTNPVARPVFDETSTRWCNGTLHAACRMANIHRDRNMPTRVLVRPGHVSDRLPGPNSWPATPSVP
jgi:hypothetical protein